MIEKSALYVWGYNKRGQTSHDSGVLSGDNLWQYQKQPKLVKKTPALGGSRRANAYFVDIACGVEHTAAVSDDGSLFTWGSNEYGQLGDGTETDRRHPTWVNSLKNEFVTAVACGSFCTATISNSKSPCDDPSEPQKGRLWVWGQNQSSNSPRLFRGAFLHKTAVKQVSCGANHAAAVSVDGMLQTWGYNEFGQLGRGFSCDGLQPAQLVQNFVVHRDEAPFQVQIASVACGDYHTAAIASGSGHLFTWGWGARGQLGHRSFELRPKEVLPCRVVALECRKMRQVACGRAHTTAITDSGALFVWGAHTEGQLGLGTEVLAALPGSSSHSRTSAPTQCSRTCLPTQLLPRGALLVACGQSHTLTYLANGRILGWGYDGYGQASGDHKPSAFAWEPSGIDWCVGPVARLAAGGGHSAVLTRAGSLRELCELALADEILAGFSALVPGAVEQVEEVAERNGSESLARLCRKLREYLEKNRGGREAGEI